MTGTPPSRNKERVIMTVSSEFSLHIHKTPGEAQRPDLYTVTVGHELSALHGICYSQPIDDAMTSGARLG